MSVSFVFFCLSICLWCVCIRFGSGNKRNNYSNFDDCFEYAIANNLVKRRARTTTHTHTWHVPIYESRKVKWKMHTMILDGREVNCFFKSTSSAMYNLYRVFLVNKSDTRRQDRVAMTMAIVRKSTRTVDK